MKRTTAVLPMVLFLLLPAASAGQVIGQQEISLTEGNLGAVSLLPADYFGSSVASAGDIDGDGTLDLLVGVEGDDDGGRDVGSVRLLFLNPDGTVRESVRIGAGQLPPGALDPGDYFGSSVAAIQDLNVDGFRDIAVGARGDDDGSAGFEESSGALWLLFLDGSGAVLDSRKISEVEGGFGGDLDAGDVFGRSLAFVGNVGEDGTTEIAVGAPGDDDGGPDRGALWILSLNPDGTVASQAKVSDGNGLANGGLSDYDGFGSASARIAKLEGGGIRMAVGSPFADPVGASSGELWFIDLDSSSGVTSAQIPTILIYPESVWSAGSLVGRAVAGTGDLNDNGSDDLLVGLPGSGDADDDGEVWFLDLQSGATAVQVGRESAFSGAGVGPLADGDRFGQSLATLGDLDGDGRTDYVVGAPYSDDGAKNSGSVYVLFDNRASPVSVDAPESAESIFVAPYPNPVADAAVFRIQVVEEQHVRIDVYDLTGRRVATVVDARLAAGIRHEMPVDTSDWPSGTYLFRLTSRDRSATESFVVVR